MAFPDFSLDKEQCLDHTTSDAEQEIVTLLVESRSCSNKDKSLKILHQVKALCEKAMGQNNQMGYELMIETLSDLQMKLTFLLKDTSYGKIAYR